MILCKSTNSTPYNIIKLTHHVTHHIIKLTHHIIKLTHHIIKLTHHIKKLTHHIIKLIHHLTVLAFHRIGHENYLIYSRHKVIELTQLTGDPTRCSQ